MIAKNTSSHSYPLRNATEPVPGVAAIWSLLRRQYRSVLIGTTAGVMLAGIYCLLAPHAFESTTKILVIRKDPAILALNGDSSLEGTPTVEDGVLANHVEMLASETVAAAALKKNGLGQRKSIVTALDEDETPVDYVFRNLRVNKGGEGSARSAHVVSVGFRHTHAKDCRDVLSSLVECYQDYLYTTMRKPIDDALAEAIREREKFAKELNDLQHEEEALRGRVAWNRDSLMVQRANVEKLRSEFRSIQAQRIQTESRLNTVRALRDSGEFVESDLVGLIGQRDIGRLGKLVEVQEGVRDAELLLRRYRVEWQKFTKFGPDHPKKRQITAAIAVIQEDLARIRSEEPTRLVSAYVTLLTSDLEELKSRNQVNEAQLSEEEARAESMVEIEMHQKRLARQIERCESSSDEQCRLVQQHEAASRYGGFNTEIINPVQIGKQVAPKPTLFLALGTVLGMCLGVAIGVVRDQSAQTFCDDDDVSWTLGLPVLGRFCVSADGACSANGKRSALDPALVVHHRPASREAEPFRRLQSLLCQRSDRNLRLLQVTSVGPGDGKTTLAANLAISLAQAGKRVLLVDANLKRSLMAEMFSIQSRRGLSTLLAENGRVSDVVQQTEVDNLWLVPSGPGVDAADNLLMQSQFIGFLNRVYEEYDFVIVDGPALTADADSIQIASQMDGVVLTVDFQKTRSGSAVHACEMLSSLNTEVLGIVVDASPRSRRSSARAPVRETTLHNKSSQSADTPADRCYGQRPSTRPSPTPLAGCMAS